MSTPWFRFYSEVRHDPKVQRLPCEQFRLWVNVLCIANANTPRGVLPDLETLAYELRSENLADLKSVLEVFVAQGLLDRREDGTLSPHNWEARQQKKDANAAERMRRMRDKRQQAGMTQHYTPPRELVEERTCCYCLQEAKSVRHLLAVRSGGTDDARNLAVVCTACSNKATAGLLQPQEDIQQSLVLARFLDYLEDVREPIEPQQNARVTRNTSVTQTPAQIAPNVPEMSGVTRNTDPGVTRNTDPCVTRNVTPVLRSCYAQESESDSIDSIARSAALARDSEEASTYRSVLEGWGYTPSQIQAAERVAGSRSNAPPKTAVSRFSRYLKTIMDDTPALAHHAATNGTAPHGDDMQAKTAEMYRRRMKLQSKGEP